MCDHGLDLEISLCEDSIQFNSIQGIAPAGERSEWTKSTDMATTMWATLRADGFKPPFSSRKDVMVLTATAFELDKKTTEAVANLAELDIMNIAFKNTDF